MVADNPEPARRIERLSSSGSLIDLFDRALDRGVVVEASRRAPRAGIDLRRGGVRLVVRVDAPG